MMRRRVDLNPIPPRHSGHVHKPMHVTGCTRNRRAWKEYQRITSRCERFWQAGYQ